MKVAIIHYWLVNRRGGEQVIEALCELYPEADIFTHTYSTDGLSKILQKHKIRTTFVHHLPRAQRWYQSYLPVMPIALEELDLRGYDLVISSESGPAKGVISDPGSVHICYCHSPMRYVWDLYHEYRKSAGVVKKFFMAPLMNYLRIWDVTTAARVDRFIANSNFVAKRIKKYYRREAEVINPPVNVSQFEVSHEVEDFYIVVGQLVPYKRVDIAVEAFNLLGRRLLVIGDGPQRKELEAQAASNIEFMGYQPIDMLKFFYSRCKALIFPGIEDFGMVPVEAMASGRPVIAYRKGGAMETVVEDVTGLFFDEQSAESLITIVKKFEKEETKFDGKTIQKHAYDYSLEVFRTRFEKYVEKVVTSATSGSTRE